MEIHVLRHTAVATPKGICYGQSDVALHADSLEHFERVSTLVDRDYDAVYCSPLSRCRQLAEYLALPFQTDERLKELNFGTWELTPWEKIPASEIDPWYADFVRVRTPGGESLVDLEARVSSFFREIKHGTKQKILIIAHAGVLRLLLNQVLHLPLKNIFDIPVDYGSLSGIQLSPTQEQIFSNRI